MRFALDDTIAAVASPPGPAARGVVRISGPGAVECLRGLFQAEKAEDLSPAAHARAVPGGVRLADWPAALPAEVYFWPAGRSYTGQAVAEIHTLGSPPLVEALLQAVCAAGARLAERGEFTLRAFLCGRMDLTQAEAVAGTIDAADPRQLEAALGQLAGNLARPLARLRGELLDLLAELEAGFDFPDEDLAFVTPQAVRSRLAAAAGEVQRLQVQICRRATAGELFRVVMLGPPNAGKSSLFNALSGGRALVSDLPGTTRDYLVARLDLDGTTCELVDTAGRGGEPAGDPAAVERAAAEAAEREAGQADLRLVCCDATQPWGPAQQELWAPLGDRRLLVRTKCDAAPPPWPTLPEAAIATSSRTGQGLDELRHAVRRAMQGSAGAVAGTAQRCGDALRLAGESLAAALDLAQQERGEELIAATLRAALEEIGRVAGAVYTDDVLEVIFSRFCIGK